MKLYTCHNENLETAIKQKKSRLHIEILTEFKLREIRVVYDQERIDSFIEWGISGGFEEEDTLKAFTYAMDKVHERATDRAFYTRRMNYKAESQEVCEYAKIVLLKRYFYKTTGVKVDVAENIEKYEEIVKRIRSLTDNELRKIDLREEIRISRIKRWLYKQQKSKRIELITRAKKLTCADDKYLIEAVEEAMIGGGK